MKKSVLFLLVLVLLIGSVQVAFADPNPPNAPTTGGACHMNWWEPGTGPGNANGVEPGERGMYHVHMSLPHGESKGGANMSIVCPG